MDNNSDILVIGCGRQMRRDDQVGLLVADDVARAAPPQAHVIATESPADLLGELSLCRHLIVVDAAEAKPGHPPGTWQRFDGIEAEQRIRTRHWASTHTVGVGLSLKLARALGMMPPRLSIYAIAVEDVEYGWETSPAVDEVVSQVSAAILEEVAATTAMGVPHA